MTQPEILNVPKVAERFNALLDAACEREPDPDGQRLVIVAVGDLRQFVGAAKWAWERDLEARYAIGDYISGLGNKYEGETREETEARQLAAMQRFAAYRPPASDEGGRDVES